MSANKFSKKIAWVHTDLSMHRIMSQDKERELYKNINQIVCVSEQAKNKFLELYPEYSHKSQVIYNLIDKK